ncbi:MAG: hypothetical protein ACRDK4_09695 [Solirubrobacteraceae bacterium]
MRFAVHDGRIGIEPDLDAGLAYNDEEQITGLFTMIEEHLALPFDTEVLGITVTATKIDLTASNEIVAICTREAHRQTIPILQLPVPDSPPDGWEWIEAYRRWAHWM